jgi:MscS family membrane protein
VAGPTRATRLLRRLFAVVAIALICTITAAAQDRGPLAPPDTSTPRATLESFLAETERLVALHERYREAKTRTTARAIAEQMAVLRGFFDLDAVPPALRLKVGGEAATELADILVRLPPINLAEAPGGEAVDAATRPDFWTLPETEIVLARMTEGPARGLYRISADTLRRLPEFHARVIDYPPLRPTPTPDLRAAQLNLTGPLVPEWLERAIPAPLSRPLLGTPIWKVMVSVGSIAILIWLNLIWSRIVSRLAPDWPALSTGLLRLTRPVFLGASAAYLHLKLNLQLNLQGAFAQATYVAFVTTLYAAGAWAAGGLTRIVAEAIIASPRIPDVGLDASLIRLLSQFVAVVAAGGILIYGASALGIPAAGLITGVGVGGLGVALAARLTLENLFGAISLFADRPFRIGDTIAFDSSPGIIEEVGPRSSRIRSEDGTVTTVPNADLAARHISNHSRREHFLFCHVLRAPLGRSSGELAALLTEIDQGLAAHPKVDNRTTPPTARVIAIGQGTCDIEVRALVTTAAAHVFRDVQHELLLQALGVLEAREATSVSSE